MCNIGTVIGQAGELQEHNMASLYWKVKSYLEANGKSKDEFENNITLRNDSDGNGSYISTWNVEGLTQPTEEQLTLVDAEATTDFNNNRTRKTRKRDYGDIGEQLDEIFKDIDAWKARIQQIKSDNPKG